MSAEKIQLKNLLETGKIVMYYTTVFLKLWRGTHQWVVNQFLVGQELFLEH